MSKLGLGRSTVQLNSDFCIPPQGLGWGADVDAGVGGGFKVRGRGKVVSYGVLALE
jgi:hypothetical protein